MAVDMDVVHASLQYPAMMVEVAAAGMMLWRWHWARSYPESAPAKIDTSITFLLGMFILAIGIKQSFWMVQGALQAADLYTASRDLAIRHWFPIAANAAIILFGVLLIRRIGHHFFGVWTTLIALSSMTAFVSVGMVLSGAFQRWQ